MDSRVYSLKMLSASMIIIPKARVPLRIVGIMYLQLVSTGLQIPQQIAQSLQRVLGESVAQVYYKSETTLPYKANLDELDGPC